MQWAAARDFGENDDGSQSIERLRIRYPRPYWEYVSALSEELDLDPYLILSIARQESTYRPGLTSHAGAKGVMQLMPRTAKWLGETDKLVSRNASRRLHEPRHSLRMGAVYFRRMLDRSDGNVAYALASYNAGPGNFDKWRKRSPNQSIEEFVEAIPFNETRSYVKRILAHYATYKSIYSE
jgi:soluble lytic murein transglycosylase